MDINSYLVPGKRAHLAGIGGVSMSPLAEVLHSMGLSVQGSDMNDSPAVEHLRALGIPVAIGHAADNLGDADFVVRTAAIHDDNPEISGAVARGIPVFERAQAWGAIMHGYRNALCISGTHGKTTTTSMATHIFMAADTDPTVMIGGTLPLLHSGYRVGHGDTIIAESCEYCNSFLSFFPTVAVILNVEADHLDFFKDLHDVEHSFRRFAELVPADGHVVANWDDAGVRETLEGYTGSLFTFSERGADAHCHAENLVYTNGLPSFDVICMGQKYAHVALEVGGERRLRPRHPRRSRGARPCHLHRRGPPLREKGQLSRRGRLRRLRPPSRRAARPADDGEGAALPAHRLRLPAAHLHAHKGAL